jgi:hypothetical protein
MSDMPTIPTGSVVNAEHTDRPSESTRVASRPAQAPPSKSDSVIKLLTRARGATLAEIGAATAWQPHSIRAFLSGLRKKGRTLVKEARRSGETAYRISPKIEG